ncbi:hypothetical protein SDC9_145253 [bioreactor metagenome]|uniref:Uncharacterized protein n=1 Tax=bioreactor metagenome TaxID=1076179 RepID=A0A645EBN0_9ZZZZ
MFAEPEPLQRTLPGCIGNQLRAIRGAGAVESGGAGGGAFRIDHRGDCDALGIFRQQSFLSRIQENLSMFAVGIPAAQTKRHSASALTGLKRKGLAHETENFAAPHPLYPD